MKKNLLLILTLCSGLIFGKSSLAKKDSNFVRMAVEHTLLEIKLAQLAQTKASSSEVKSLATELVSYHTKALGELKLLAGQKNITVVSQISEKSQKHYDKLATKQGADFDKAYTKCVAQTHKGGACALKRESEKSKDTEIKAWAATNYTTLEKLHENAKTVCKTLKNSKK